MPWAHLGNPGSSPLLRVLNLTSDVPFAMEGTIAQAPGIRTWTSPGRGAPFAPQREGVEGLRDLDGGSLGELIPQEEVELGLKAQVGWREVSRFAELGGDPAGVQPH